MSKLHRAILSSLMVIFTCTLITGFEKDAEAGEFVLSGSGSIMEYKPAIWLFGISDADLYSGTTFNFQPEYRFAKWFGLGLDVGFGGLSIDEGKAAMTFEAYLTAKFIAPLESVDLWLELGTGTFGLIGRIDVHDEDETINNDFMWSSRARIGITFNIAHNVGMGLQFGAEFPYIVMPMWGCSFEAGLHLSYHF